MNILPYLFLFLACLLVTIKYHSKSKDFISFALSKNTFGPFALLATIVASFVGGGTIVGVIEKSYLLGIAPAIGLLGFALQIYVTGQYIAPRIIKKFGDAITVGDIFESHYGRNAKMIMSVGWFLFCIGIVTAQFSSLTYLIHSIWPQKENVVGMILALFVTIYSTYGGIVSVIRTDIVQFVTFAIVIPIAAFYASSHIYIDDILLTKTFSDFMNPLSNMTFIQLLALILIFFIGDALIPPVVQRILITDDVKLIKKIYNRSTIIICILVACAAVIGFTASWFNSSLDKSQVIFYASNNFFGFFFRDIFITALVAVVISTADSYLNSCSVSLVHDVIHPIKNLDDKAKLFYSRIVTIIVGVIAILLTNISVSILDIFVFSYKFWGPIIVVPLTCIMFDLYISRRGFYISSLIVAIFMIFWNLFRINSKIGIDDVIPSMILDAILFYVFYRFEAK